MEGRTLAHALTGLLVLRSLGCTLDIEAWHYRGELTEGQRQLAERVLSSEKGGKLRVREIEGEAERVYALGHREPFFYLPKRTDRRNYQIKIEAIMASSFEQVISLDSDNVPTMDPTFLFSEPEYLASSALFFPNFWRPAPDHPMWTISNLPWRFGWELETGQLVISKPKAWCGISLSLFFLQSDAYQPQYIFGDHDAFYYGLLAANIFFNIVKWPLAVGGLRSIPTPPATVAKATEFCGLVMVQNHPQRRNVSLFYHTHSLKYGALYGQAYRADNETVAGKGPFPHVLRYGAATDPVKMRGLGYHNSAGVWCASLGGEGEAGVEMEWSDTDVAFTRRWQEARFKADTLLFG
ncbi:mannosyltransferase putative-domain-containing protein [Hyaloraphidium curvatum]|nr:mannosyltransferase putative-domain-containing protein [Hyaloraphidium curvatum]